MSMKYSMCVCVLHAMQCNTTYASMCAHLCACLHMYLQLLCLFNLHMFMQYMYMFSIVYDIFVQALCLMPSDQASLGGKTWQMISAFRA